MKTKQCSKCNEPFLCGSESMKDGCWCNDYPPIFQLQAEQKCLCATCLQEVAIMKIEAYVKDIDPAKARILDLSNYQTDRNLEGIDYYIEEGKYVFTKWYHLKRGHCCESGCRHCPYGYNSQQK